MDIKPSIGNTVTEDMLPIALIFLAKRLINTYRNKSSLCRTLIKTSRSCGMKAMYIFIEHELLHPSVPYAPVEIKDLNFKSISPVNASVKSRMKSLWESQVNPQCKLELYA